MLRRLDYEELVYTLPSRYPAIQLILQRKVQKWSFR